MDENKNMNNNGVPRANAPRPGEGAPRVAPRPTSANDQVSQRPAAQSAQRPQQVPQRPAAQPAQRPQQAPQRPAAHPAQRPQQAPQRPAAQPAQRSQQATQRPAQQVPQRPEVQPAQRPQQAPQRPQQVPQRPAAQPAQRPQQVPQRPAAQPAQRPQQSMKAPIPTPPAKPAPNTASPENDKPLAEGTSASAIQSAEKKKTTLSKAGAEMMSSAVKAIIYMAAVFVIAIFISIIVIRVGNDVFALVKSDEVIDVTIPEDADISDVANILHDNSIISFPGLFVMYGNIKNDNGVFIAGDYSISPAMSYDDLRYAFKPKPVTGTSWITIPEGYTVDEIITLMVSHGIGTREGYIDVINNYDFDYWFVDQIPENEGRHYRLEGYLFPDTYEFYNSSSEVTVINKLLARFDEVFVQAYRDKAAEIGLSIDQIITIASLIEKEAGTAADYRYVSSVFHNRLNNPGRFPKLESDATTVYAMQLANNGVRPEDVSADEIRNFDSPYNSYLHAGLIPGAIANPSASAIRYALYPTESTYFYFISDGSGKTYFSSSEGEHQSYIDMIKAQKGLS